MVANLFSDLMKTYCKDVNFKTLVASKLYF